MLALDGHSLQHKREQGFQEQQGGRLQDFPGFFRW